MTTTLILTREHIDAGGTAPALVIDAEGQRETHVRLSIFGTTLCVAFDTDAAATIPTPEPERKSRRQFKGNLVNVPDAMRDRLIKMPYPDLCKFAKSIGAKPSHLAKLGDTITTQLYAAITDGFTELDTPTQLPMPDLPPLNN